jgi:3',5'-cyclic AMP phosphodiesterase CpdA
MTNDSAGLRFAHLSDPHLTTLQDVRWNQLLSKRALGYLSWRRRRRDEHRTEVLEVLLEDLQRMHPEHVVITGDLTHVALPDEFRQARRWLERVGTSERVTVIPGNHDAYVRTAWDSSWAHWAPYMVSDPAYRDRTGAADLFPSLRVRNGVALIGLSSAVASPPFMATGALGAAQRDRLEQLLRWAGEQGLFRLVLLHHPPRVEAEKWRKRLTDGRALCDILGRAGAELILHGHGHRLAESGVPYRGGRIPVFGIASASAVGHSPGREAQYDLYQVERTPQGWSVAVSVRRYQAARRAFVQQQERQLSVPAMPSTSS